MKSPQIRGLVLAAGAGRRFGGPKALARTAAGASWLELAVSTLRSGGCTEVLVALGAEAGQARTLLPDGARPVEVTDWATGMAASLRAGLAAAWAEGGDAVVVVPVDTPGLPAAAVRRVIDAVENPAAALIQATYDGAPGHPVLIGRSHGGPLAATLTGDTGARVYLRDQGALRIECSDLWSGHDIDH